MPNFLGKIHNSQKGFSLLEIVITIAIIGMILLLYQIFLSNLFLSRDAKNQEIALRIANNKIEELRAVGYDSLPVSGTFSDTQLSLLSQSSATMTITDFNVDTKQILVTIQWIEPSSPNYKTISLTTLVTKAGGL
jgi:prepilin-type N-terminal cleavage/methylation domain-containing protein